MIELAAKFFEATLAARARRARRAAISPTAASSRRRSSSFRIGYAPAERFALKEHLGAQGISAEDMIEAGLLVSGEDIPVPYDRFRDRVMFPITDLRGRVIAFGGRALEKDAPAKYLNSPETPLFHKGATLYNVAAARKAAHEGAQIVVVEGYVDVIAHGDGGLRGAPSRRSAPRSPKISLRCCGRWPTSRCCASTATAPAGAPPTGRSISRCRTSSRARPCSSRCCPRGRTRTIWCARAGARRSAK